MATTSVITTQTSMLNTYTAGRCNCFDCTIFSHQSPCIARKNILDWEVGATACCGSFCPKQRRCVPPDLGDCLIDGDRTNPGSLVSSNWHKHAPALKCTYNLDALLADPTLVERLVKKFGIDNTAMADICEPPVLVDEKVVSPIHTTTLRGKMCRKWFETVLTTQQQTEFLRSFCATNPTAIDCLCVNRHADPTYKMLKTNNSINDGCWYTPCVSATTQFIEVALRKPTCPTTLCNTMVNIIGTGGNVNIGKINQVVNCQLDNKPSVKNSAQIQDFAIVRQKQREMRNMVLQTEHLPGDRFSAIGVSFCVLGLLFLL